MIYDKIKKLVDIAKDSHFYYRKCITYMLHIKMVNLSRKIKMLYNVRYEL